MNQTNNNHRKFAGDNIIEINKWIPGYYTFALGIIRVGGRTTTNS